MAKNEVVIKFLGDASGYDKAAGHVQVKTQSLGKTMAGVFGGIGAAAAGREIFQFGQSSVAAFKESETASARLSDAFAKFPKLADSNSAAFERLAEAQAKKTRFDDDATKSGQAALAQFGLTGKQIMQLTPLMQDYAAKTGKDLPTAAEALGKAVLGQGRGLKEIGIKFKDTGSAAGNFEQLMGGLNAKVGGFAEREGKTAAGQSEILKNQFGELQESVGSKLLPVLTKLTTVGLGVVNFFSELSPGVQTAIGVVVGLLGAVFLITKAVQAWTAVQAAFNVVMALNPAVLVAIAIAALIAAVVLAYQKVDWFRSAVDTAWGVIKGFAGFLVGTAVGAFNTLKGAAEKVGGVLSGIWDGMSSAARTAFNGIKSIWNSTIGKLSFKVPDWVPGIGGKGWSVPKLHTGGIFHAARPGGEGLALLKDGERVLSPTESRGSMMGGGGLTVIVQTGQTLSTDRDVEDAVRRAVEGVLGRGGRFGDGRGRYLQPA